MAQANVDLGPPQDTKLTDRVYARESAGLHIVVSDALSRHRGVVALFYKDSPRFAVETHQQHGLNIVSFQLVMGRQRWDVVDCYLTQHDVSTLERVVAAIVHQPRGTDLLVASDLNADLESLDGNKRDESISSAMAMEVLEDMEEHFLPLNLLWTRYIRTWSMLRVGQ